MAVEKISKLQEHLRETGQETDDSVEDLLHRIKTNINISEGHRRLPRKTGNLDRYLRTSLEKAKDGGIRSEDNAKQFPKYQLDNSQANVFENVVAAQSSQQVIVSTSGSLVSAAGIEAGFRAKQYLGQMSDSTLMQLSKGSALSD